MCIFDRYKVVSDIAIFVLKRDVKLQLTNWQIQMEPGIERVQALPDISHWSYVVTVMKPMHRLQICPIMHHNGAPPTIPPSYMRVRAVVWECGEGQTHTERQTHRRAWPIYISRARCIVIATKPVHRSQIRPILDNYGGTPTIPKSYIRVRGVVCAYGRGQTDGQPWPLYSSRRLRLYAM